MDRLIYTAMTGASQVLQQQAAVAENLANANTTGFRAELDTFRAVPIVGEGLATRTFVVDSTSGADFTPGVLHQTGRTFDVAVQGKGWLAVRTRDGKEAYTRNGNLQVSAGGVLQTGSGLNVVGESGPLTIPPGTDVTIAKDGTISTVPSGSQPASVVIVGRMKLVNPPDQQLDRGADGMFRLKTGKAASADAKVGIVSGSLEDSNVNPVEAMVNMISLSRKFDMQMKMLQTADTNAQQATQILNVA
ncbi:MAG: flagellar basal-body rod protein FlgF [Gallionella sp.]|nr:flagellar basal-body rod protein FlgF [Gallionella sp.]